MKERNPFIIIEEFVPPMYAEELIDSTYGLLTIDPLTNIPERTIITNPEFSEDIEEYLTTRIEYSGLVELIERTHNVTIESYGDYEYHWYPEGFKTNLIECDAFQYSERKWYRVHDNRDFTCILMLKDYASGSTIDPDFEVYGGKIEMTNWNFSFNSARGTLICFPSCPRFCHHISEVELGEQNFIKFRLKATQPYVMDISDFSGNPTSWFNI